jgi:hypothetical protein
MSADRFYNKHKGLTKMAWAPELKQIVIDAYVAAEPTPDNSTEIIKDLADKYEQTANGVRMILVQAGVYVKKDPAGVAKVSSTGDTSGKAPKRVSKEEQINTLRAAITDAGQVIDEEIIEKLTGKVALYFAGVISAVNKS